MRHLQYNGAVRRLARTLAPAVAAALASVAAPGCSRDGSGAGQKPAYRGTVRVQIAQIEFDDGDTFDVDGKPIRVLGIDTPEIAEPDVGIFEDQPYGRAAAESTRAWITRARVIELARDGRDIYDRRLAHVFVDGELLGVKLLEHGLAYENVSHFGDNGFPDLADRILRAAEAGPKPPFEPPHRWRKKHQKATTRHD
jgi:endonuclease YncB( thermonuclease family)